MRATGTTIATVGAKSLRRALGVRSAVDPDLNLPADVAQGALQGLHIAGRGRILYRLVGGRLVVRDDRRGGTIRPTRADSHAIAFAQLERAQLDSERARSGVPDPRARIRVSGSQAVAGRSIPIPHSPPWVSARGRCAHWCCCSPKNSRAPGYGSQRSP